MASTGMVLVAVWRNLAVPGLALVAAEAMQSGRHRRQRRRDADHHGRAHRRRPVGRGRFLEQRRARGSVLAPLTDIFAIPAGLPFANVFSIGDVLIAVGVVLTIAIGMRRGDTRTVAA